MIVVVTVMIMTRGRSLNTGSHGKNQLLLLLLLTLMLKLVRLYSAGWHYFEQNGWSRQSDEKHPAELGNTNYTKLL